MSPRVCIPWLWCACVWACVRAACPPCAPAPAPAPAPPRCQARGSSTDDECFYRINGTIDFYYSTAAKYFGLKCVEGLSLEESALPAFPSRAARPAVTLRGCAPPAGGRPYRAALARLRLAVLDRLALLQLPGAPPLRAHHFLGLGSLRQLHITAGVQPLTIQDSEATIFAPLTNLTSLTLSRVHLTAAVLASANSTSLESISLTEFGLQSVPAAWLCALPALRRLALRDDTLQELPSACRLSALELRAPRLARLPKLHTVVELTLSTKEVVTLDNCEVLKNLSVSLSSARALPEGWLGQCGALEALRLHAPQLRRLPEGLFLHVRNIHTLSLTNNNFTEFPSELLAPLAALRSLELSRCGLGGALGEGALGGLGGLPLRRLSLAHNPLGDTCPQHSNTFLVKNRSKLATLTELEELSLSNTGSTRLCPDWRQLPRLRTLDLRRNRITELAWEDLKWKQREHPTEVLLANNPLTSIVVAQTEYEAATPSDDTMVKFVLDQELNQPLHCDCYMYWFAKALEKGVVGVRFENLRCLTLEGDGERSEEYSPGDSVPIQLMPTQEMECPLPGACPANCSCRVSPARGGALLRCGGDGRGGLPDLGVVAGGLQSGDRLVLEAAGAGLRALPPAWPRALRALDLRRNRLARAGEGAARALFAGGRAVRLAGNPLDCACAQPLLRHLAHHLTQVEDKESVQCADKRSIMDAVRSCFESAPDPWGSAWGSAWGGAVWGAAGGGALALALGAAALLLLRRAPRLRLRGWLLARGLCLRWAAPSDAEHYKYDVFISYAHADSAVAEELVAALEGGGLRACVHHRDWPPGGWIPHQIAMSVAQSRRTVALLSPHFLQSGWARAEFREAYGRALREGSTRLIVVLLGAGPPPALDREMRHYVTNNTYLRWGEPAFWEKLKVALPPPRAAAAHSSARGTKPGPADLARGTAPVPQASPPPAQSPPTPVVKFADMEFPTPNKPLKPEPCHVTAENHK